MLTGQTIRDDALSILSQKWGYIYGTSGEMWTATRQQEITRTKSKDPDYANSIQYGAQWIGHMVADCSGLVCYILRKHGVKLPHGSNSMWNEMREKGKIAGEPPVGALVFKLRNGSDYYHVGIYVGDGAVVEAQGAKSGVVKSKLKSWTHYGLVRGVEYKMPEKAIKQATVSTPNGGVLNLRAAKSTTAGRLALIPNGTVVDVLDDSDVQWYWIRYHRPSGGDIDGFVVAAYLDEGGGEAAQGISLARFEALEKRVASIEQLLYKATKAATMGGDDRE